MKQSKPQKVQSKTKNEKPSGIRNASSALMKKTKDGKTAEVRLTASNGRSVATNSHLKQPLKNRSCNERQANASKVRVCGITGFLLFAFSIDLLLIDPAILIIAFLHSLFLTGF